MHEADIVALVVFVVAVVLLVVGEFLDGKYPIKKRINDYMMKNKFIVVGLTLVSIDLLGDAIQGESLFKGWFELFGIQYSPRWMLLVSLGAVSLVAFVLLRWINKEIGEGVIRVFEEKQSSQTPKKLLFWTLSTHFNGELEKKSDEWVVKFAKNPGQQPNQEFVLTGNIKNDLDELKRLGCNWNWLQMLRGIMPHIDKGLEEICIIASKDKNEKGSFLDIESCFDLLKVYKKDLNLTKMIVDFDNMVEMAESIRKKLGEIRDRKVNTIKDEEIIFDITGGTKLVSIAVSSMTFSNNMSVQYIDNAAQSSCRQINYVWVDL